MYKQNTVKEDVIVRWVTRSCVEKGLPKYNPEITITKNKGGKWLPPIGQFITELCAILYSIFQARRQIMKNEIEGIFSVL